jgi:Domain of unknown function (DUF4430)
MLEGFRMGLGALTKIRLLFEKEVSRIPFGWGGETLPSLADTKSYRRRNMSVSIEINNSGTLIYIDWHPRLTVHQALQKSYNQIQNHVIFSFAIDYHGTYQSPPYGYFVVMVDGTCDLPDARRYWALLVNGAYATRGIDYIELNDGDAAQLNNVPYSEEEHRGTTVEIKHNAYVASLKR